MNDLIEDTSLDLDQVFKQFVFEKVEKKYGKSSIIIDFFENPELDLDQVLKQFVLEKKHKKPYIDHFSHNIKLYKEKIEYLQSMNKDEVIKYNKEIENSKIQDQEAALKNVENKIKRIDYLIEKLKNWKVAQEFQDIKNDIMLNFLDYKRYFYLIFENITVELRQLKHVNFHKEDLDWTINALEKTLELQKKHNEYLNSLPSEKSCMTL